MADRTIGKEISRNISELWWLWVVQAIVSILFGIAAIFWPGLTLVTLVYLLAPFVIAIGLSEIVRSLMTRGYHDTWWMSLIIGFMTLGAGVYFARHPEISFATFILVLGITFIVWGVLDVARAFLDRVFTTNRTLVFISGVGAIAAGIITLMQPAAGGIAFVWVIGLYSLLFGTIALVAAIDHHREYQELKSVFDGRR